MSTYRLVFILSAGLLLLASAAMVASAEYAYFPYYGAGQPDLIVPMGGQAADVSVVAPAETVPVMAPIETLPAVAPLAAPIAAPIIQSGGFTHSYSTSSSGGTFQPPQTQVSELYYNYPGISPYGLYPGSGYAYDYGLGLTPNGYGPYGGFTYL